jgi:tRNA pseudouridine55 synthase
MPKVLLPNLPLSGLFGVVKPSGPTSMSIINDVKQLVARSALFVEAEKLEKAKGQKIPQKGRWARDAIKIGQGGTLDPLADGVLGKVVEQRPKCPNSCVFALVVGVGKGTKKLSDFLDCTKVPVLKTYFWAPWYLLLNRNTIPLVCSAAKQTHMIVKAPGSVLHPGSI